MTNYISYPFKNFYKGCCVICFEKGDFSSCYLSESKKKYLLNSSYLDGAYRIDYKSASDEVYHMTYGEFTDFIKGGELKPETSESYMLTENGEIKKCQRCGKTLSVKVSSAGQLFYGCTGYPECKYTDDIK